MYLLEKWQCHKCEKGWLLIQEDAEENEVRCPYCSTSGEHVEAVAGQDPEDDWEAEMGCLWPGYNTIDKLTYQVSRGQITSEQFQERVNAVLRAEKPDAAFE